MRSSFLGGCYLAASAFLGVSATGSTAKIDVHAHFLPEFYVQALKDAGHTPGPDGMPAIPAWTPEAHLEFMKEQNIDKVYLSISSPGVYLTIPSKAATKKAVTLSRQVNKYASQLKAKYPKKFGFFASLPLPDVEASLEEIKYSFTKLNPKPDGVVLMSNFYGMYFGDPDLDPVYKALNGLNVTIFEHPTTPCTEFNELRFHTNAKAPVITQEQWRILNRPISTRQFAVPTLDFPFDTARTFADLFYSGVPTRFSSLKWIIPHAGGGLIPTMDRIVGYSTLYPDLNLTESSMKATLAKSFYFDLAGPWPVTSAIPPLLRWVDYTNILWGSDTPFTPWASAAKGIVAFDQDIEEVFDDSNKAKAVRQFNAKRLFD
ncbi:amidohydrolase 2 [Dactylonectria estremocensis]|uniref:6-methylsalicylate decarboxylase n=1 Tax=Dactylonectria estremocensis TaxID=1079267 RepID=A0A9P9IIN3_9HYPO|nr:amidohydrolase 2 [Dactylonectria estremocensis]